jgi:hypothetical protein
MKKFSSLRVIIYYLTSKLVKSSRKNQKYFVMRLEGSSWSATSIPDEMAQVSVQNQYVKRLIPQSLENG